MTTEVWTEAQRLQYLRSQAKSVTSYGTIEQLTFAIPLATPMWEQLIAAGYRHVESAFGEEAWTRVVAPTTSYTNAAGPGAVITTKDTNPKDAIAGTKVPLELCPAPALYALAAALFDGATKYGRFNWRKAGVRASVYMGAAQRHLQAWFNGEDTASDGVQHLGHALACIAIVLDAQQCGKLTDDRPPRLDLSAIRSECEALMVASRERNKDKTPKHYTIEDS